MYQTPVEVAIAAAGSVKALAMHVGRSSSAISLWRRRGVIPSGDLAAVWSIVAETGGNAEWLIVGRHVPAIK